MNERKLNSIPKDLLFSLDIGTRNVVGMIARKVGDRYTILDYETMAHPERAMFDGQIHDIEKVTSVVRTVVERIENRQGYKIEQAAIAAAGRSLKTKVAEAVNEIDLTKEITKNMTDGLEIEAIQLAQAQLSDHADVQSEYYCVGYTVINYYLDNSLILNPLGHKGQHLKVEIIATFLPHIVVDSLYAVIHRAGLEVMNLTLEPIAAINVAIPQKLRMLNLALVDIGAGTSDIAISKEGAITSYGMVALAGDEITEQIAQNYLLDFNAAEALKIQLMDNETVSFTDILGLENKVKSQEVLIKISDTIDKITGKIAKNILKLNHKSPSAIFCIGGGAQIPDFTGRLAKALKMPAERVVIKPVETLELIDFLHEPLKGPEFITPIGIGVTAFEERENDFIQVTVNDNTIRLFNSKKLRVADALILAGINARNLLSKRGMDLSFSLDGKEKHFKGEYGEPSKIFINGIASSLDGKINHKDQITVIPATEGKMSTIKIEDLNLSSHTFTFNGQKLKKYEYISVNEVDRTSDYIIKPNDSVKTRGIKTFEQLCLLSELNPQNTTFFVNEKKKSLYDEIQSGDEISLSVKEDYDDFEIGDVLSDSDMSLTADEKPLNIVVNGNNINIESNKKKIVFVDVFDYIDFDITEAKGILELRLNGNRAGYTDGLKSGDEIEIFWK